jgi:multidrug efflux pump subunit AcrA (membrane-fusion protein)
MSVYAEIITGEKQDVPVVPREAVTMLEGKKIVFVIEGEKVRQKEVEVGLKDVEKVEIVKGLSPGEKIAISNLDKLKDGERIRITEEK